MSWKDFSTCDLTGNEILAKRAMVINDAPVERKCKRCGANFLGTRTSKYCESCRPVAKAQTQEAGNERLRKKRAEAKARRVLPDGGLESLSPRQVEILEAMADGLSYKEIAEALGVSPNTVKAHRGSILSKLRVRNSVEAVSELFRYRSVSLGSSQ